MLNGELHYFLELISASLPRPDHENTSAELPVSITRSNSEYAPPKPGLFHEGNNHTLEGRAFRR